MPESRLSLSNKVAIVTGSRRGIGKAIALALSGAGADVVVCDIIYDSDLEEVVSAINANGQKSLAMKVDISRHSDVEKLVGATLERFGHIDILVNNAATYVKALLTDHTDEEWDKVLDTNLKGYYLCSRAVGQTMVKQKSGCIVNISSRAAFNADEEERGSYCVAKAGVNMLTKALARELGKYNIRVNGIAPGLITTELTKFIHEDESFIGRLLPLIPLRRPGEPDEIANAVLFLASDAASYISAHTLVVDGGRSA